MPADCRIERLDDSLILRTIWGPNDVQYYGGLERWKQLCRGYCLLRGDEILSEATAGPCAGIYEPGVITREDQRGKGYGTMVTARLLQEIEAMGGQTYWNCDKDNVASAAIGRKLGYRRREGVPLPGLEENRLGITNRPVHNRGLPGAQTCSPAGIGPLRWQLLFLP